MFRGYVLRSLVALVLLALGSGAWMVYRGIAASLQAERTLQATLFAIRLVDQFVAENGRWPHSWAELEKLVVTDDSPDPWPTSSPEIRRRVSIDFDADPLEIAAQDAKSFTAIKPVGPHYEYRDYGFVPSLQATIRRTVKRAPRE
jgi:hypothetical protein